MGLVYRSKVYLINPTSFRSCYDLLDEFGLEYEHLHNSLFNLSFISIFFHSKVL